MKRWIWTLGILLPLCAGTAASAATWAYEDDPPRLIRADGDEDLDFLATCEDGAFAIIYMAPDRAKLTAGRKKACDAPRPCREALPVTLLVDGQATVVEARAQPEEMYGGYEIHLTLGRKDAFWTRLAKGGTLALKVDGTVGEKLPLKGVAKPLAKLLAACKG